MSWQEDHRNIVAERWAKKYRESKMTEKQFTEYMREFMFKGGWDEDDINIMISKAIKRGVKLNGPQRTSGAVRDEPPSICAIF